MKATEFVKKFGLNTTENYADHCVNINDLRRLVESHELVNEFFNLEALGFDKTIELAKKQIEELEDNETVEFWHRWDDDLSCTVARMKQAIADVEACQ